MDFIHLLLYHFVVGGGGGALNNLLGARSAYFLFGNKSVIIIYGINKYVGNVSNSPRTKHI